MADISGRDGETLSDEQTFGGSGTLAQFVASERRSTERAVGVIGAYVAEERREMLVAKTSGDEAQARFNSINADCVEHFLAETAALRAECARLRADKGQHVIERRAADYLAGVCSRAVHQHKLDARSEIGDALLDYASTRHGDSNPIGGVDAVYQQLRAARAAVSGPQTGSENG